MNEPNAEPPNILPPADEAEPPFRPDNPLEPPNKFELVPLPKEAELGKADPASKPPPRVLPLPVLNIDARKGFAAGLDPVIWGRRP